MSVKDRLEIILLTYNRCEHLKNTLEQLFSENSPVKDFDITILNNKSNDGTYELIEEYRQKYQNIKHIINNRNIGGNGNIAKAFTIAEKEYVWIICDDDFYDWSDWNEVELAIGEKHDVVVVDNEYIIYPNEPLDIIFELSFLPSGIYKTSIIDDSTTRNIYDNIAHWFPHLPVSIKVANTTKDFYILKKSIVQNGQQYRLDNHKKPSKDSLARGAKPGLIYPEQLSANWQISYINSLSLLKDTKDISKAIKIALKHPPHGVGKTLNSFCRQIVEQAFKNRFCENMYYDVYCRVNLKIRFVLAFHKFLFFIFPFYRNQKGIYMRLWKLKMKIFPFKQKEEQKDE